MPLVRVASSMPRLLALVLAFVGMASYASGGEPGQKPRPARVSIRVAGAQIPVTNEIPKNVDAILRGIEYAAREKADVLVTPEGSLSGYTRRFEPSETDRAIERVVSEARKARVALVLGTCFADSDGSLYDAQRFYDRDGTYLGFHSKILLCRYMPEPEKKGEADYFKSTPLRKFQLGGLTVGGLVCNDLWANPEWTPMPDPYLVRQLADKGAGVIFHSVNAGLGDGEDSRLVRAFHESNLRIRARTSKVWIVTVGAADPEGSRSVQCPSGVVGPDGRWAVQADPRGERFFAYTLQVDQKESK